MAGLLEQMKSTDCSMEVALRKGTNAKNDMNVLVDSPHPDTMGLYASVLLFMGH